MSLASWNDGPARDGDPRLRRARDRGGRGGPRAARRADRGRSTTTARCGARSRPTSRRSSSSRGCASRPRPTRRWPRAPVVQALLRGDLAGAARARARRDDRGCCSTRTPGMTTEEFAAAALRWLEASGTRASACRSPGWSTRRCSSCCDLLRAHGFRVFIVTGGGVEFVRRSARELYGVEPDDVVGSARRGALRAPRRAGRARAHGRRCRLAQRGRRRRRSTSTRTSGGGRSSPSATAPATARCSSTRTPAQRPSLCLVRRPRRRGARVRLRRRGGDRTRTPSRS